MEERNELLWQGKQVTPVELVMNVDEWLKVYKQCHGQRNPCTTSVRQRWAAPSDGWLKCKFDCASVEGSKRGGFGVVVSDKEGSFVAGMAGSSDWVTSSLLAELLAARKATSFCKENFPEDVRLVFE
ncbi:hypothetical protein ACFX13_003133 [Malus domestica]